MSFLIGVAVGLAIPGIKKIPAVAALIERAKVRFGIK